MMRKGEQSRNAITQITSFRCAKCGAVFHLAARNTGHVDADRLNMLRAFQSHLCGPVENQP